MQYNSIRVPNIYCLGLGSIHGPHIGANRLNICEGNGGLD